MQLYGRARPFVSNVTMSVDYPLCQYPRPAAARTVAFAT
jgi:hypothetical protein